MDDDQKMFWLSVKKPVPDIAESLGQWPQLAPNKPDLLLWYARMWQGSVLQQPSVWEQRGSTMKTMWYPSLYNIETMTKGTNFSYFTFFLSNKTLIISVGGFGIKNLSNHGDKLKSFW